MLKERIFNIPDVLLGASKINDVDVGAIKE